MAFNSLSLLLSYESDCDDDSGYKSEDEKKRKADFDEFDPKCKVLRKDFDNTSEEMHVDSDNEDQGTESGKLEALLIDSFKDEDAKSDNSCLTLPSSKGSSKNSIIPLPKEFAPAQNVNDDPTSHHGRIRSFPHERGNWASLLYVPLECCSCDPFSSLLQSLCASCKELDIILHPSEEFHISLSRTLILRLHWLRSLIEEIKVKVGQFTSFPCCLHGLKVYTNDEKSRTFLGLKVWQGQQELSDIVSVIDESLDDYKLPRFYQDRSFHVSVAWCVGDRSPELEKALPLLEGVCKHYFVVENDMRAFEVAEIHFKTGNRVQSLKLKEM